MEEKGNNNYIEMLHNITPSVLEIRLPQILDYGIIESQAPVKQPRLLMTLFLL